MKAKRSPRKRRQPPSRRRVASSRRRPTIGPRSAAEFFKGPESARHRWTQALHALARMRTEGASLRQAARAAGVPPAVVLRSVGTVIRKDRRGRFVATDRDRLLRVLVIPSQRGPREIVTRDSAVASQVAAYAAAVQKYLTTGDGDALKPFRTLRLLDANGKRIPLLTSRPALNRLGNAGVLSFESLYARRSR